MRTVECAVGGLERAPAVGSASQRRESAGLHRVKSRSEGGMVLAASEERSAGLREAEAGARAGRLVLGRQLAQQRREVHGAVASVGLRVFGAGLADAHRRPPDRDDLTSGGQRSHSGRPRCHRRDHSPARRRAPRRIESPDDASDVATWAHRFIERCAFGCPGARGPPCPRGFRRSSATPARGGSKASTRIARLIVPGPRGPAATRRARSACGARSSTSSQRRV
jgi:hypothetical protein